MKRRLVSSQPEAAEVNITPLLDIVFILLIFFIVTATFLQETGIGLIAPQDDPPEEETRPPPTMVLTVQKDGFVLVDDVRLVDPRSVKPIIEAFKAAKPQGVVLVSAAPDSRVETTVLVIDQSRQAGVDPAITLQTVR
jgi:biopolymer transport protein ExbD